MSFDTLAPYYRAMEAVTAGRMLQHARNAFQSQMASSRSALLLGEGPGKFLVELLRTNRSVRITCVERSPRMIAEARRAIQRQGENESRIMFITADALTWQPPRATFDTIVTNFFLDCFSAGQIQQLVERLSPATMPDARWLLTDFCEPDAGWRRWRAKTLLAVMYGFFRMATNLPASRLTPPDAFLAAAGFRLTERRLGNFGFVHSDLWTRGRS